MGWATLFLMAVATAALLVLLGVPRMLWMAAASFLMIGAAGYAWQGEPTLPAHDAQTETVKLAPDPGYKQLRDIMFGRFGAEAVYFGMSDIALSSGDTGGASRVLMGAVNFYPRNSALWTELGNAIALHDEGNVSPASLLAFRQAMAVSPSHPGPPLFLGLAYMRVGQVQDAEFWLQRALKLTPPNASYRSMIVDRLDLIREWKAMMEARMRAMAGKR